MKKKTIEKIPYLGLRQTIGREEVKYVGVTAIKIIAGEKNFFLEVYGNREESKEVPIVRIVIAKKDFATFFPESGEWTKKRCDQYGYTKRLAWRDNADTSDWKGMERENVLQSQEDLERIKRYCGGRIWNEERWWEYIAGKQERIASDARWVIKKRKIERRQQALKERQKNTKPLPEKEILEMADCVYFREEHHLYYKKHGNRAQIACSACGGVTNARWRAGESYESQFERWTEEPRENQTGTCPMCGARGIYKCQGKAKRESSKKIHVFLGQKYKRTGMVMRYIEVEKKWHLGLISAEKGEEMYNACEELSGIEIARAYFEPGEKTQIDYQKHNPYDGKNFWDDCNLYGMRTISIKKAPIMKETYEEMEGTIFQYSALQEYADQEEVNPIDYFERYQQTPQIEILTKIGLIKVVKMLVEYKYGIVADPGARRPDKFLGIRKERVKQLIEKKGDIRLLEVMQMEKRMQRVWTDAQIAHLAETGLGQREIEQIVEYMSIQKLLNRIERYACCEYGTECSSCIARIQGTATTYADYINMRLELGYDMTNTVYQQPRNLRDAHEKMLIERDKEEVDKRMDEVKAKYPRIWSEYKRLRKRYLYEDEEYLIRPARSAEEIVMEGRILHHCVGGDNYLRKHNDGISYILMLRRKTDPESPYITVEVDGNRPRIMQWYGAQDRKPDERNMQKWLNGYIEYLKTEEQVKAAIA